MNVPTRARRRLRPHRRHLVPLVLSSIAIVAVSACGTAARAAGTNGSAAGATTTRAAAYVDVWSQRDSLSTIATTTGIKDFVLAFALADDGGCTPSWGGTKRIDDPALLGEIDQLQSAGGTVTVATGGASGDYLENACSESDDLTSAYRTLLATTGSSHLEVDVEQNIDVDTVVDALSSVQREDGTAITLTLQVQSAGNGLTDQAIDVLTAARDAGLDVTVNAMLMNFPAGGNWGSTMVTALDTVADQIRDVWTGLDPAGARAKLGLTYMIGVNDTGGVTTEDDAQTLVSTAVDQGIGSLALWSIARDNGDCARSATVANNCSGIAQDRFAFATALSAATTA